MAEARAKGAKAKKSGRQGASPRGKKRVAQAPRARPPAAAHDSFSLGEDAHEGQAEAEVSPRRRAGRRKANDKGRQFSLAATGDPMNIQLPGGDLMGQLTSMDRKIEKHTQRAATCKHQVLGSVGKFLESE